MQRYWSPDDSIAQDIGELLHEAYRIIQKGRIYHAPLQNPQRILDLGSATGLIPLELGEEFPQAEIIGTDINPAQFPPYTPDNVRFIGEDFTTDWSFPADHFDFIHSRFLHGAMSYDEWGIFFQRAFHHLKPGGWVESTESHVVARSDDGTVDENCPVHSVGVLAHQASEAIGRPIIVLDKLEGWMRQAGFVDVKIIKKKNPIGRWPRKKQLKLSGDMMRKVMSDGMEGFCTRLLTIGLGMSPEEAKRITDEYSAAINDKSIHSYFPVYTVIGRKPEMS